MSALLEVARLSAGYGLVNVLNDVSIAVPQDGIVALVGANGAGKSTLLRAISGLIKPSRGTIRFAGQDIGGLDADQVVDRGLLQVAEGRRIFRRQSVATISMSACTGRGCRGPRRRGVSTGSSTCSRS